MLDRNKPNVIKEHWDPLKRADIQDLKKQCVDAIPNLKKRLAKHKGQIGRLNAQIRRLEADIRRKELAAPRQPGSSVIDQQNYRQLYLNPLNDLKKKKADKTNEVNNLMKEDAELNPKWQEFSEENRIWCESMLNLLEKLEDKVSIRYQLYIEVEGQKIEIVRTAS